MSISLPSSRLGSGADSPWENRGAVMVDARLQGTIHYPVVDAWLNDTYSVQKLEHPTHPGVVHLIVRRHDNGIEIPWRDLQSIKDRFGGRDCWALEMFPPVDAVVDNHNLRHIWVMPAGYEPPIDLRQVKT